MTVGQVGELIGFGSIGVGLELLEDGSCSTFIVSWWALGLLGVGSLLVVEHRF